MKQSTNQGFMQIGNKDYLDYKDANETGIHIRKE